MGAMDGKDDKVGIRDGTTMRCCVGACVSNECNAGAGDNATICGAFVRDVWDVCNGFIVGEGDILGETVKISEPATLFCCWQSIVYGNK